LKVALLTVGVPKVELPVGSVLDVRFAKRLGAISEGVDVGDRVRTGTATNGECVAVF